MCQVLLWVAQSIEHTELRHYIPRRKWYTIDPSRIGFTRPIRWTRHVVMEILNVLENEISQLRNSRHCFVTRVIITSRIYPFSRSRAGLVKFGELVVVAFGVYYPKTTEEVPPLVVGSDQPLVGLDCSHQPYDTCRQIGNFSFFFFQSPLQLCQLFLYSVVSRWRNKV